MQWQPLLYIKSLLLLRYILGIEGFFRKGNPPMSFNTFEKRCPSAICSEGMLTMGSLSWKSRRTASWKGI